MGNQNPGIHIPSHGACNPQVRQALQDIVRHLGTTSTPVFESLELEDLTINTPIKIYALDHDSWTGFVADEHIAHSSVSIVAGDGMSGGGTIAANRTLTNADRGSVAVATHEGTYNHVNYDTAYSHSLLVEGNPHNVTAEELDLAPGEDTQAWSINLDAIAALTPTDGNFIVGNGTTWVTESGATARDSIGLGTTDSPVFAGLTIQNSSEQTVVLMDESEFYVTYGGIDTGLPMGLLLTLTYNLD